MSMRMRHQGLVIVYGLPACRADLQRHPRAMVCPASEVAMHGMPDRSHRTCYSPDALQCLPPG